MNLRCDSYFVEDRKWHEAEARFAFFLEDMLKAVNEGRKAVLLELGVGFNTPTIVRFPFEKLMREYDGLRMIRLNMNEAVVPKSCGERMVGINAVMSVSIKDINKAQSITGTSIVNSEKMVGYDSF